MAETSNLGLQKINSSDFVSPDPINNNMDKLDKLGVDYIIEQGKSGEWWYRKWKSGRAECGVDNKHFGASTLVDMGNIWQSSENFTFGAYPFAFKSAPFVSITHSMQNSTWYGIISSGPGSPTTLSPYVNLWRHNHVDINDAILSIFVTGFYK